MSSVLGCISSNRVLQSMSTISKEYCVKLTLATLAETAYRDEQYKLCINKIFHQVLPNEPFPATLTTSTLVLEWEAESHEVGQDQYPEVMIYRPPHEPHHKQPLGYFNVPEEHFLMGVPSIHNTMLDLTGLVLPSPGRYEIEIYVNSNLHGSAAFHVHDAPDPTEELGSP